MKRFWLTFAFVAALINTAYVVVALARGDLIQAQLSALAAVVACGGYFFIRETG